MRPFAARDYAAVWRATEIEGWGACPDDPLAVGRAYERFGRAFTLCLEGGAILGVAGITWKGPPVGEAWIMITPLGRRDHPLAVARMVKRRFLALTREMGLRRVQADILTGSESQEKWARWLGFQWESDKPLFGLNGETYSQYVMFPVEPSRP